MLRELAQAVQAIYADIDAAVARFQTHSGLVCPPGCGQCCLFGRVEATVLEFLPLAFGLHRLQQAEELLDRLLLASQGPRCLLYQADRIARGEGGCSQYAGRPLVCRLFGFAGNRDRQGVARLALCRTMKEQGNREATFLGQIDDGMPIFAEAGMRMTSLHPAYGTQRLPINKALAEALAVVGMSLALTGRQDAAPSEDQSLSLCPGHPDLPGQPRSR